MARTVKLQYRKPSDGALDVANVTVDLDFVKRFSDADANETFVTKASYSGVEVWEAVDEVIADLFEGRPSSAKSGVVQTYVDSHISSGTTSITTVGNPSALGFETGVPVAVMSKYGTIVDYIVPSAVSTTDLTVPASGFESLEVDAYKGYILQMLAPRESSEGENSAVGIKAYLERPNPPTVSAEDSGATSINVTLTAPTSNAYVIKYYDIYVIKSTETEFDPKNPYIEPNRVPDKSDQTDISSAITVTTYKGGSDANGGSITAGDYYVVAVAKDNSGMVDINESALSNVASVTVA